MGTGDGHPIVDEVADGPLDDAAGDEKTCSEVRVVAHVTFVIEEIVSDGVEGLALLLG